MLTTLVIIVSSAVVLALIYLLADRALSAPRYRGPRTDHFDGRRFHNLEPPERKGFIDVLRWQLTSKRGRWNEWTDNDPASLPPPRVGGKELRVTFVNHATVLIQTGGVNILTDPVWSERVSPVTWAGPKRHRPPGLRFEDLPPIDVVLISHNHYDHLDIETLVRLREEHRPRFLVGLGNRALLDAHEVSDVTELDWWETANVSERLGVMCVPAKHFSGRGLGDADATLWCGYVVRAPGGNVYFAGDTGMGSHFAEINKRFGPFRLALLPIGAYLPVWFMHPVHLSPGEAAELHKTLKPRVSMAIHFGTFALGDDGEFEPVDELRRALNAESRFWVLEQGEGRDVP
ncbi:MAG: MBL fold metallo-hydrolase [Acidobacteria bacterium]|nr:MBL fold metallo-hydrolase [Acidobacteriota bacterium]